MAFKNPKLELNKEEYLKFSKEAFSLFMPLYNFLQTAPPHLSVDIKIKREFGVQTDICNFSISYPVMGDSEMFRETNPEKFNYDSTNLSDTVGQQR